MRGSEEILRVVAQSKVELGAQVESWKRRREERGKKEEKMRGEERRGDERGEWQDNDLRRRYCMAQSHGVTRRALDMGRRVFEASRQRGLTASEA